MAGDVMGMVQASRWCKRCRGYTLHARTYFGTGWGCFLTIITAGLFFPVWLLIGLVELFTSRYRCQQCGKAG